MPDCATEPDADRDDAPKENGGRLTARILIVDDDAQVRGDCSRLLGADGHECVAVASGNEALQRLPEDFDLVLTDLNMPGAIDGNELAHRVRLASGADVIMMTGHPELATAILALREGASDYLIKPIEAERLRWTVERCLEKRKLSKELAREKSLRQELGRANEKLSGMGRMSEAFGQFVTPEVARYALARGDGLCDQGELKDVTVLFVDVRSFTPFAAAVSPRESVTALNEIYACVIAAVQAEGGILNKFIGDGMMALFGAPTPLDDHASAAARAAVAAMKAIETLARSRKDRGLIPLRVGMGLNTGEVIAGCLGTARRAEYSVIGDPVNVASRLEEIAKPGQILVGPETAERLKFSAGLTDHGPAALTGLPKQITVREISSFGGSFSGEWHVPSSVSPAYVRLPS